MSHSHARGRSAVGIGAVTAVLLGAAGASGQCGGWYSGGSLPGGVNTVSASLVWDPDGPGPLGPRLVVGGSFDTAGNVVSPALAFYDLASNTWSAPVGGLAATGTTPLVSVLKALPDGRLLVGGRFSSVGGVAATGLAVYNGTSATWSVPTGALLPPPSSPSNPNPLPQVYDVAVLSDGRWAVVGNFSGAAGMSVGRNIALWSSASGFQPAPGLGSGFAPDQVIGKVIQLGGGDLLAAGPFTLLTMPDGSQVDVYAKRIFRLNLSTGALTLLPDLPTIDLAPPRTVLSGPGTLLELPGGDLYVGGGTSRITGFGFSQFQAISHRLVGGVWQPLTGDLTIPNAPNGLFKARADGTILAASTLVPTQRDLGGQNSSIGVYTPATGAWNLVPDSTTLSQVASALTDLPDGRTFVGYAGTLTARVVTPAGGFEAFPGVPGISADRQVTSLIPLPGGEVLVAGAFSTLCGAAAGGLARYNLQTGQVTALGNFGGGNKYAALRPDGTIVLTGDFDVVDGVQTHGLVEISNSEWSPLGNGPFQGQAFRSCVAVLTDGRVVAGGGYGLSEWDGASWSLPGGNVDGIVYALQPLADGSYVAAGAFTHAGGAAANYVVRRVGASWQAMGAGLPDVVNGLALKADGTILSTSGSNVYQWNAAASTWTPVGQGFTGGGALRLAVMPDQRVIAVGPFRNVAAAGPVQESRADGVAVFDGSAWRPLPGGGLRYPFDTIPPYLYSVLPLGNNGLLVGGLFSTSSGGTRVALDLARYTFPCVADFNCSGAVTVQDIFDFLAAYFAGQSAADFNHSGGVTVQDIFDFLSAYFTGCPG